MQSELLTYYFRKFVNHIVESTWSSPSLAEMVRHHLVVDWTRQATPPYAALYQVFDGVETYLEIHVLDARGYEDPIYDRGKALLRIGVNGALVSPDDEAAARRAFAQDVIRTCACGEPFSHWLDYYAHRKLDHLVG